MLIQVYICDHCGSDGRGVPFAAYRIGDGPTLHICRRCEGLPFKRVEPHARGMMVKETVRMMTSAPISQEPKVPHAR